MPDEHRKTVIDGPLPLIYEAPKDACCIVLLTLDDPNNTIHVTMHHNEMVPLSVLSRMLRELADELDEAGE